MDVFIIILILFGLPILFVMFFIIDKWKNPLLRKQKNNNLNWFVEYVNNKKITGNGDENTI